MQYLRLLVWRTDKNIGITKGCILNMAEKFDAIDKAIYDNHHPLRGEQQTTICNRLRCDRNKLRK